MNAFAWFSADMFDIDPDWAKCASLRGRHGRHLRKRDQHVADLDDGG